MTTQTKPRPAVRPAVDSAGRPAGSGRLASALRRLPAVANDYTLFHFNAQHELRAQRRG